MSQLIQRHPPVVGLGAVGHGGNFLSAQAILGMGSEQIDVPHQVILLRRHRLQKQDCGPGVIHCPVAVFRLRQTVGFDGVAQPSK